MARSFDKFYLKLLIEQLLVTLKMAISIKGDQMPMGTLSDAGESDFRQALDRSSALLSVT